VPTESEHHEDPPSLELTDEDKLALRRAQLELLAEFDRVCSTLGIEYFALYGTLLGAVRHQGFIPWDDDLDVGLLRADYDRLCEAINDELGERFFFQTVDSDPHYGCMFGKLRLNGTRCVDRISYGSKQHGGIFMDVFPLDARATRGWARFEQKTMRYVGFRLLYLKARYQLPMRKDSVVARIAQVCVRSIVRVLPRRVIIALTKRHTRLGPRHDPTQYVSLFSTYRYERDTHEAAWMKPPLRIPFEDVTVPVPANADAYLSRVYGNYRQLPPPERQIGYHGLVELDFGNGS
jgi:lipopolysaccharide cholinephosphotransferase